MTGNYCYNKFKNKTVKMINSNRFVPDGTGADGINLTLKEKPEKCPFCGSDRIKINSRFTKNVLDIDENGKILKRKIKGVRCLCRGCGKTFTPGFEDRSTMTDRLLSRAADCLSRLDRTPQEYARNNGIPVNTLKRNLKSYYKSEDEKAETLQPRALYLYRWQNLILYIDLDFEIIVEAGPADRPLEFLIEGAGELAVSDNGLKRIPSIGSKTAAANPETLEKLDKRIRSTLGIPEKGKLRVRDTEFARNRILYGGNRQKPKKSGATGRLVLGSGRILA